MKGVILFLLVGTFSIWGMVKCVTNLPIVYISHSQGKCVDVWDKESKFSCDNMPKKYEHVWVK